MTKVVGVIIGSVILIYTYIYLWQKLDEKKCNIWKLRNIFIIMITISLMSINYLYATFFVKIFLVYVILLIAHYFLFQNKLNEAIIHTFIVHVVSILSDFILLYIILLLNSNDINYVMSHWWGSILGNIIVVILTLIILNPYVIDKFKEKISYRLEDGYSKITLILFLILILTTNIVMYISYFKINSAYMIIINCSSIIIYTIISFQIFNEHNKSQIIQVEYDSLLDKSVEYENIIFNNKRDVHETKNELIVLRGMIKPQNKEAINYLDAMIKEYSEIERDLIDNNELQQKVLAIPSGGLSGLLYHKLLVADKYNIHYDLRVGRQVNNKVFQKIDYDTIKQFIKIVGIYLDNAIASTKDQKDKELNIEVFIENGNFCILIANTFSGLLDFEKFGTKGYTTKGEGHGYGLALANEILKKYETITSETSFYKNIISQTIKIKM